MAIDSISGRKHDLPTIKTTAKSELDSGKKVNDNNSIQKDTVAITSAAQEIKKTIGSSEGAPVDAERVAKIKKAIADGSYTINADKIAQKMIQLDKSLHTDNSS